LLAPLRRFPKRLSPFSHFRLYRYDLPNIFTSYSFKLKLIGTAFGLRFNPSGLNDQFRDLEFIVFITPIGFRLADVLSKSLNVRFSFLIRVL
jgi:hypothetical protein